MRSMLSLLTLLLLQTGSAQTDPLPPLVVSPDGPYLLAGGEPFFWLGGTAWELLHRTTRAEATRYLDDRAAKGFNVVQTVILAEENGLRDPSSNGELPLHDEDPTRPNERYFAYVDTLLNEAARRGMYVALLPTWGDKWNLAWGQGPEVFTPKNAEIFGRYLGNRYRSQTNLVWVLGGDRWPEDDEDRAIIRATARGIRAGGATQLMTYHPNGGQLASNHFDEPWLDFDFFQTGHDADVRDEDFVKTARERDPLRPAVNGEPLYDNHPNKFDPLKYGWLDAADVRRKFYRSMLRGAAGFTLSGREKGFARQRVVSTGERADRRHHRAERLRKVVRRARARRRLEAGARQGPHRRRGTGALAGRIARRSHRLPAAGRRTVRRHDRAEHRALRPEQERRDHPRRRQGRQRPRDDPVAA